MSLDGPLASVVAGEWSIDEARQARAERIAAQQEMAKLQGVLRRARASGEWGEAMKALDAAIAKRPGNAGLQLEKWNVLLLQMGNSKEAYAFGEKLVSKNWDDPMLLNQVAWTVVDDRRVKSRDTDFALRVAKRAAELTDHKDGAILDTLARAYYEGGELARAVEWQRKAVKHAAGPMKEDLQKVLEKYEAEKKEKKGGVAL